MIVNVMSVNVVSISVISVDVMSVDVMSINVMNADVKSVIIMLVDVMHLCCKILVSYFFAPRDDINRLFGEPGRSHYFRLRFGVRSQSQILQLQLCNFVITNVDFV